MLMFESGEQPRLNLRYVFDWKTEDVVTLSFELVPGDFDTLISELLSKGSSSLQRNDNKQELFLNGSCLRTE